METTHALSAREIIKSFGATTAVNKVSIDIACGEIVALLGKNGAGKTTFLDIALGLQQADKGQATLFGMPPREAVRRSLVGVVQQTGALLEEYTVRQCLGVFAAAHIHARDIDEILAETRLTALAKRPIRKLSGGEKQRVRLALALLPDPRLLILDEPTAGMDALARRDFWALMRQQATNGRTIIFATHYLAEAEDFAQRTIVIKDGSLVADAETFALRQHYARNVLRICVSNRARTAVEDIVSNTGDLEPGSVTWNAVNGSGDNELVIRSHNTDALARHLLAIDGTSGLTISASSLEDVFAHLTA